MSEPTETKTETVEAHPALGDAEIALTQLERACDALRSAPDRGELSIIESRLKQARTSALAALKTLDQ